jgi:hypothetical protein
VLTHLSENKQRVLRIAINWVSRNGVWDLDELKIEFEERILADAPIVSRPEDLRDGDAGDPPTRFVRTDEPYNVPISITAWIRTVTKTPARPTLARACASAPGSSRRPSSPLDRPLPRAAR